MPVYVLLRASIRDFGPGLANQCSGKSSACSGRSGNEVRIRFHSSLPRRRMVPPAERRRNASVHRFLISGPNLGIDVKISPKTTFFMHRFLISSPDLRIDARISPKTTFCVHRFLISGSDLRIDAGKPMQI